jgi:hypothetical protein
MGTRLRADDGGSIPGEVSDRVFLFSTASGLALGPAQPSIRWVPGAFCTALERPGLEAGLSPPSTAEVDNAWSCASTLMCLRGVVLG